jgi:Tfp pilus assembly protein PilF
LLLLALGLPAFAQHPSDPFGPSLSQNSQTQGMEDGDNGPAPRSIMGTLSGSVLDIKNHPVDNALVSLRDLSTGMSVTTTYTTPDGSFEFSNLQHRSYELVVTAGLAEARQRVDVVGGMSSILVRFPTLQADYSGQSTVSVADMKVPSKARNELHKAEQNMDKKNWGEARKQLTKALEIHPGYSQAHMLLGLLNAQEQRPQEAAAEAEKAVQCDPSNAMAFVALASIYNWTQHYTDAVRALDSGTRLAPNAWQIYLEMAKARLGMRELPAALQQAEKAEQLCPSDFPSIHLVKAHVLIELKDYPKATAELEQYIRRVPQGSESASARRTLEQVKSFITAGR